MSTDLFFYRLSIAAVLVLTAGCVPPKDSDDTGDTGPVATADLIVVSTGDASLHGFDLDTSTWLGEFVPAGTGGMAAPAWIRMGPGPYLFVTESDVASGAGVVYRFELDGTFVDVFVDGSETPDLLNAQGIEADPDGNLLIASYSTHEVLRFAGPDIDTSTTGYSPGDYMDVFVSAADGGLDSPVSIQIGLDDGMASNLLVCSSGTQSVKRYDRDSGAYIDDFVAEGEVTLPIAIHHTPTGTEAMMYITDATDNSVKRFSPVMPGTAEVFVSSDLSENGQLGGPSGIFRGPAGYLYVSSFNTGYVNRYEGPSHGDPGAFVDTIDTMSGGGINQPSGLAFITIL